MNKRVLLLVLCAMCAIGYAQKRQSSSWQGTGWAINNGYVVTNHHVVDGARLLTLTCYVGDSICHYNGEVAVVDADHDLAIIRIADNSFHGFGRLPYALTTEQAEVGESVFVLGYPMTQILGDEIKLSTGVISSRTGYQGDVSSYQISAPIQPGNSGGPLFDESGNVIGCVNAKVSDAENVGYAIKGIHIKNLISSLPLPSSTIPSYTDLVGKSLPQKVKAAKQFIFTIFASVQGDSYSGEKTDRNNNSEIPNKPKNNEHRGGNVERHEQNGKNSNGRTIESPYVDSSLAKSNVRITRISMGVNETTIEFVLSNRTENGYATSVSIDPRTYLRVGRKQYVLTRAENIAIAPSETRFSEKNDHWTFRLVFPALPQDVTSFDVIEPNTDWVFFGISTK